MITIEITPEQFADFCDYHDRRKWRWPAVFSCNPSGEVWVPEGYGYTPFGERDNLRERLPLIAWVADAYWPIRDDCGRFFIDHRGAFYKPARELIQFVRWDSGGENLKPAPPVQLSFAELEERRRRRAAELRGQRPKT